MSGKNKNKNKNNDADNGNGSGDGVKGESDVKAGGWEDSGPDARWQKFPGPAQTGEPLRVNFTRDAYADVISHAKAHLDKEICGVLAGEFCEDDEGLHIKVMAAVRGVAAKQTGARVTFTHETWNSIHETMEKDYPKLQIVGWYHSHPGFGVEFSDMDLFIQKNFFSGRGQVAMVTDPLGGDDAMCIMSGSGIRHLGRFWVDGREKRCKMPKSAETSDAKSDGGAGSPGTAQALRSLEDRLSQTLAAMDAMRANIYRFVLFIGLLIAMSVVAWIGYSIYKQSTSEYTPPMAGAFSGPVKLGDHWYWVGSQVVSMRVSSEMEAKLYEFEQQKNQAILEARQKSKSSGGSDATSKPANLPVQPAAGLATSRSSE